MATDATADSAKERTIAEHLASQILAIVLRPEPGRSAMPDVARLRDLGEQLAQHGVLPFIYQAAKHGSITLPSQGLQLWEALYCASIAHTLVLEQQLGRVLTALHQAGVEVLVLKGLALASTVYPDTLWRPFSDLDLVVRESSWADVHRVLLGLGFAPDRPLSTPPPKVWRRKAYYHLGYFEPTSGVRVEVHYDLWQIGLVPRGTERYWTRSRPAELAGAPSRILSPEDLLLHLCVHIHDHGFTRLIWCVDLAMVLEKYRDGFDWDYFVRSAREESLGIPAFYSLQLIHQLWGTPIPHTVLKALKPTVFKRWLHRRVFLEASGPSAKPAEPPPFRFHEVPVARELVLNLLLMGRVPEKLWYLVRLVFFPSPAWLAYYYDVDDARTIAKRYLVHGPKLLFRWASDLLRVCLRKPPRESQALID